MKDKKTTEEMKLSPESVSIWFDYVNRNSERWIDPKNYTVVIEHAEDCLIANHVEWLSTWKGTVLKNNEVVFSCNIALRDYIFKEHAFLKTFEVFMYYKNGENLLHVFNVVNIENLVYNEELDK